MKERRYRLRIISYIITVLLLGALVSGLALAQAPIVYPAKGQSQQQTQDQWAQQEAAQYSKKREAYNRAHGACLEGKGYTVK